MKGGVTWRRTVELVSLQQQEQMSEQRCSHSIFWKELCFYSAELLSVRICFVEEPGRKRIMVASALSGTLRL